MPKYDHYTALNAPRAKVLDEALLTELLTVRKRPSPKNVDEGKICHFHHNHGNSTNECTTMKDEIERLVRAVYLQKYVKEGGAKIRSPP